MKEFEVYGVKRHYGEFGWQYCYFGARAPTGAKTYCICSDNEGMSTKRARPCIF